MLRQPNRGCELGERWNCHRFSPILPRIDNEWLFRPPKMKGLKFFVMTRFFTNVLKIPRIHKYNRHLRLLKWQQVYLIIWEYLRGNQHSFLVLVFQQDPWDSKKSEKKFRPYNPKSTITRCLFDIKLLWSFKSDTQRFM